MANHYIRLKQGTNFIEKSFSTDFENPIPGDILIAERSDERHFNLELMDDDLFFLLKYENGEIISTTGLDQKAEKDALKFSKIKQKIWELLNSTSLQYGIDGINSASKYAIKQNSRFTISNSLLDWTYAVWDYAELEKSKVDQGNRSFPVKPEDFLAEQGFPSLSSYI